MTQSSSVLTVEGRVSATGDTSRSTLPLRNADIVPSALKEWGSLTSLTERSPTEILKGLEVGSSFLSPFFHSFSFSFFV